MSKKVKKKQPDFLLKSALEDLKKYSQEKLVLSDEESVDISADSQAQNKEANFGNSVLESSQTNSALNYAPAGLAWEPPKAEPAADDKTNIIVAQTPPAAASDDKTLHIHQAKISPEAETKTLQEEPIKVSFGAAQKQIDAYSSPMDPKLRHAENLKLAQERILELENEIDKLIKENQSFSFVAETTKHKLDEMTAKVKELEFAKKDIKESYEGENRVLKDSLSYKDHEISRLSQKTEELESRLANDLKKIRVKERELENRLELAKMEKTALLSSKDETILDLKRKIDNMSLEIDAYKSKIVGLSHKIDDNQDQLGRTVRALRLALTHLESNEVTATNLTPLKKAD